MPICESCGSNDATAVARPVLLATIACDACWLVAQREPSKPAPWPSKPGIAVPGSHPSRCSYCDADIEVARTPAGERLVLDAEPRLTSSVPAGHRWRLGPHGEAISLGNASPTDTCRVRHRDVCPAFSTDLRQGSRIATRDSVIGGTVCPKCGALAGNPCTSKHAVPRVAAHRERWTEAGAEPWRALPRSAQG